jgi:hypothetical protein
MTYLGIGSIYASEPFTHILEDADADFHGKVSAQITITSHKDGEVVSTSPIILRGNITSGRVLIDQIEIFVNDKLVAKTDVPLSGEFAVAVPLEDGKNGLKFITKGKVVSRGRISIPNDQFKPFNIEKKAYWKWGYIRLKAVGTTKYAYPPGNITTGPIFMWWQGPINFNPLTGFYEGSWGEDYPGAEGFAGTMKIGIDSATNTVTFFSATKTEKIVGCEGSTPSVRTIKGPKSGKSIPYWPTLSRYEISAPFPFDMSESKFSTISDYVTDIYYNSGGCAGSGVDEMKPPTSCPEGSDCSLKIILAEQCCPTN